MPARSSLVMAGGLRNARQAGLKPIIPLFHRSIIPIVSHAN